MAYGYCQVYYDGSYPYLDIRRDRAKMDYLCRRYSLNINNTRYRALARSGQKRERKIIWEHWLCLVLCRSLPLLAVYISIWKKRRKFIPDRFCLSAHFCFGYNWKHGEGNVLYHAFFCAPSLHYPHTRGRGEGGRYRRKNRDGDVQYLFPKFFLHGVCVLSGCFIIRV